MTDALTQQPKRKIKKSFRTPEQAKAHAELKRQILALWAAGGGFDAIGRQLGKNRGTIFKVWREAMRDWYRVEAEEAIATYDARTLAIFRKAYEIMTNPKTPTLTALKAGELALKVETTRARILGYAAPEKAEITGADGAPIAVTAIPPGELTPEAARKVMEGLFGKVEAPATTTTTEPGPADAGSEQAG